MKKISRNCQRLIWWLITSYACYLQGLNPKGKPNQIRMYEARKDLTTRYKKSKPELESYKPFHWINWKGSLTASEAQEAILKELQAILLTSESHLSLSKHYMTNETAIELTSFIFEFLVENEIEMRTELVDLYKQEQSAKYTIACLKNKKCVITGKTNADLHHVEHVGTGGYKQKNVEELLVLPLDREYHDLVDYKGDPWLINKYHLTPVPHKLASGVYTDEEIQAEIENHKNPRKHKKHLEIVSK